MTTETIVGIVDGEQASVSLQRGWVAERVATVSGVEGDGHARLVNAVQHVDMPRMQSRHPTITWLRLEEKVPRAIAPDVVEVRLIYRPSSPASGEDTLIAVGGSVSQVETNMDFNGDALFVERGLTSKPEKQGVFVSVLRPEHTVTFTRTESSDPAAKSKVFVGKVNSSDWRGEPMGAWLCTELSGTSQDSGVSFVVTYGFAFRPIAGQNEVGWDVTAVWIDPVTGGPLPEPERGRELKRFRVYHSEDFNALNLPSGLQQPIIHDLFWERS